MNGRRPQSRAVAGVAVGDVVRSPGDGPSPRGCAPAGVSDDYQDYYYFLAAVGRKAEFVADRLLALVLTRAAVATAVVARDRRFADQAVRLLRRRSERDGRRNSRRVRSTARPSSRTSRREGSVGRGPAASMQHLDQRRRVRLESVDAYVGRIVGVAAFARATRRPQQLDDRSDSPCARRRPPAFARQSPQSLAAVEPRSTIKRTRLRALASARSPPPGHCPVNSSALAKNLIAMAA